MDKRFWGILIGIAAIFGVIVWVSGSHKAAAPSSSSLPTNHVLGKGSTGVTLLEYGDYECPYCGQFAPIVKQVQQQYDSQIYVQFRNLPLTQIHPNAFAAARAAEAAGLQNKFWQMHDLLYSNQDPNGASGWVANSDALNNYFVQYATQIGLNVTQFKQDYASDKVNSAINADVAAFGKTGEPEATPAYFLDGKKINPAESVSSFQQLINAEIAKKTGKSAATSSNTTTTTTTAPKQ